MSQPTADSSSPSGCSPAWLLALNGSGLAPRKLLSLCSQSAFQNATHLAAVLRRIQAFKHHLRFCCSFCKKNSLTPSAYREFLFGQFWGWLCIKSSGLIFSMAFCSQLFRFVLSLDEVTGCIIASSAFCFASSLICASLACCIMSDKTSCCAFTLPAHKT